MPKTIKHYCCICKEELIDKKPIRLQKFIYGAGKYKQYYVVDAYDFCDDCFEQLMKWLKSKNAISNKERKEIEEEAEEEKDLW